MSFLEEDDQLVTLEMAFAFLDDIDVDSDGDTSSSNITHSSPGGSMASNDGPNFVALASNLFLDQDSVFTEQASTRASSRARDEAARKTGSTRAQRNRDAVKRLHARKKAEAAHLQEQVIELEARLRQLQIARMSGSSARASSEGVEGEMSAAEKAKYLAIKPRAVSMWLEIATSQAKERYKSEKLNARLRAVIQKQMRTSALLERILRRKSNLQGLDLLRKDEQLNVYNDSCIKKEKIFFEELRKDIAVMYHMATPMFERTWGPDIDYISCSTHVKEDPMFGSFVEVQTSAPLRGSVTKAGNLIWRQTLCMTSVMSPAKFYLQVCVHIVFAMHLSVCALIQAGLEP
jgi:hypothetical protein